MKNTVTPSKAESVAATPDLSPGLSSSLPPTTQSLGANTTSGELAGQLLRLRRIGKRLLGAANCIIMLDGMAATFPAGERSMAALEERFCASLATPESAHIVPDARADAALSKHRGVAGAPYVRFYAAHPLLNEEQTVIGCVHFLSYTAHEFTDEDRQLLSDFIGIVEHELRFNAMNASQIDLIRKNRTLRRDSLVDPVIGTWNRAAITRMLATETERCYNEERPLSLVLADHDSHKQIGDQYGFPVADNILLKFASRLRSCIRPSDVLGRYEGETFMLVLPGASQTTVKIVAERIRKMIMSEPEIVDDTEIPLTVSLGTVSTDLFPAATIDDLITHADYAQRQARKAGHNNVFHAVPT
jgi:diguanylate cyclase (GGDEF)-like protein